ncbi:MAG TPA: two-component regulator propeller domain-containing protein [Pyrinomonadaceae bacterium]|jgi:signal transduction histidine kinase/ligand-binding sensor domain-containing protein
MKSARKNSALFGFWLLLILSAAQVFPPARAERLPVKIYTSADGLGSSFINSITRDSRGFMWFCTRDGLSRFDGSRFVTYQVGAENPAPGIENIYETRAGEYWISTTGGLFRFKPEAVSSANQRNAARPTLNAEFVSSARGGLLEDRAGNLWFAAGRNLNLLKERDGKIVIEKIELDLPPHPNRDFGVADIAEAADGSLWLNTSWGLVRRLPDKRIVFYEGETFNTQGNLAMLMAADGRIWLARALELFVIKPESLESLADAGQLTIKPLRGHYALPAEMEKEIRLPENAGEILFLTGGDLLSKFLSKRLYQTVEGHIWLTTSNELVEFDGRAFHRYDPAQGFATGLSPMMEDAAGNLWIGGRNGLARLDRKGLTSYGAADGFKSESVYTITESADGKLVFGDGEFYLNHFDGKAFDSVRPQIPLKSAFVWTSRYAFLDSRNEWWILTSEKLYRFAASDLTKPLAAYSSADGLSADQLFQIYEDSRGTIWVSVKPTKDAALRLAQFNRSENRFSSFTEADGYPPNKSVSSFAEDFQGNLWLGFYEGGVARYSNGRFTTFTENLPDGLIGDLHVDKTGRLWLASGIGGLLRIDDTGAETPQFVRFTTDNGLSSNSVRTITEDRFGRIYAGTVRGVDRLSPDTNRIKHYTIADGLAGDFVNDSHCDRSGTLWFATMGGLSRLVPLPDEIPPAPPILLGGLRIAGVEQTVSELGDVQIEKGELTHTENNFQIEFFGLDFRAGEYLRYQYKLEGADADWSAPTEQRSVTFANLSPGAYRFLVRAVNSEGAASERPAAVVFTILPPIWARWWFVALAVMLVAAVLYLLYRYRTARLREINAALTEANRAEEELLKSRGERLAELEKVRSRIATDLHDDIGASLTQIAILSEVARQQTKNGNGAVAEPLRAISNVSNELVGTMSDIVWSINPAKDHFSDLTQRMRRFASDVLSAKGIGLQFHAPHRDDEIVVNTNVRREVFLIFKESINNIVKHSGAARVSVEVEIAAGDLRLRIADDGKGFAPENGFEIDEESDGGNGIPNMKKRAAEMNGELEIVSETGKGTTVNLRLPLLVESAVHTGGDGKIYSS